MMATLTGRLYAHMNNGRFEATVRVDDPERVVQI